MFKIRLLSSIVIMVLTLFFIITGGNILLFAMAFLSMVAMMEILRMVKLHKSPLAVIGYVAVALLYVLLYLGQIEKFLPLAVFYLMAIMAVYVVAFP